MQKLSLFVYDCSDSPMNSLEVLAYLQDPKTEKKAKWNLYLSFCF